MNLVTFIFKILRLDLDDNLNACYKAVTGVSQPDLSIILFHIF